MKKVVIGFIALWIVIVGAFYCVTLTANAETSIITFAPDDPVRYGDFNTNFANILIRLDAMYDDAGNPLDTDLHMYTNSLEEINNLVGYGSGIITGFTKIYVGNVDITNLVVGTSTVTQADIDHWNAVGDTNAVLNQATNTYLLTNELAEGQYEGNLLYYQGTHYIPLTNFFWHPASRRLYWGPTNSDDYTYFEQDIGIKIGKDEDISFQGSDSITNFTSTTTVSDQYYVASCKYIHDFVYAQNHNDTTNLNAITADFAPTNYPVSSNEGVTHLGSIDDTLGALTNLVDAVEAVAAANLASNIANGVSITNLDAMANTWTNGTTGWFDGRLLGSNAVGFTKDGSNLWFTF